MSSNFVGYVYLHHLMKNTKKNGKFQPTRTRQWSNLPRAPISNQPDCLHRHETNYSLNQVLQYNLNRSIDMFPCHWGVITWQCCSILIFVIFFWLFGDQVLYCMVIFFFFECASTDSPCTLEQIFFLSWNQLSVYKCKWISLSLFLISIVIFFFFSFFFL